MASDKEDHQTHEKNCIKQGPSRPVYDKWKSLIPSRVVSTWPPGVERRYPESDAIGDYFTHKVFLAGQSDRLLITARYFLWVFL